MAERIRELVSLSLHQLKRFLDRSVSLTPGHIGSAILLILPLLQMQAGDTRVVLLDQVQRIVVAGRRMVADVEVDPVRSPRPRL